MSAVNESRIHDLLVFCMVTAAMEESESRWLGKIHLLKYLYLADLAWAADNQGNTYTGGGWQFYHFGPWSAQLHDRIEPTLDEIHAKRRILESYRYSDDQVRWCCPEDADELRRDTMQRIPVKLQVALQRAIRQFGSDTSSLLHFVYTTPPMLQAKPGENLNLETEHVRVADIPKAAEATQPPLSNKAMKKRREKIQQMQEALKARLHSSVGEKRIIPPPPRYDEIYEDGVAWLDSLVAEEPLREQSGSLHFSDEVWQSRARGDTDVS